MDEIERLKAKATEARARLAEAQAELDKAEAELLEERFRDVPHFSRGDKVLVRRQRGRNIFWWDAVIEAVHLRYQEGSWPDTYKADPGGHFESRHVSYTAEYEQVNGKKVSEGFWASEVKARP